MNFSNLPAPQEDVILKAMLAFRADTRTDKIDLSVGVFKDAAGETPVMSAVRAASKHLAQTETTKAYTTLVGDAGFHDVMRSLALGDTLPADQVHCAATTGGTQAIRILCELIKATKPDATLWMSTPTWPNHPVIADHVKLARADYRYLDPTTRGVDFAAMMADLDAAKPGDVVLLHSCCHNPTGADLSAPQWKELAAFLEARRLTPLIDNAYQGFGQGLEEDAAPVRMLAKRLPVTLIASSCSKNFGIYRDRAGIAMVTLQDAALAPRLKGTLVGLNRVAFSFPPDHGARVVTHIANTPELESDWRAELEENRLRVVSNREELAKALRLESNSNRFDFIAQHQGMFSLLGATPAQIETMQKTHGIYLVGDSRMNIAGLPPGMATRVARAIVDAGI